MTTSTSTHVVAGATLSVEPYIFFYGRCEEALAFYKDAIGGTYDLQRWKDSPMCDQLPAEAQNNVMHASFRGRGFAFMASDGVEKKAIDPEAGNVSISIAATDGAEGERLFTALAAGGNVKMPLEPAFWGGKFGVIIDRFGIEWMVTST